MSGLTPLSPIAFGSKLTGPAAIAVWIIGCCLLCTLYFSLALAIGNEGWLTAGWFVSDGITLFNSARHDGGTPVAELLEDYPAAAVLAVINAQLVFVHPLLPAAVNLLLLLLIFGASVRRGAAWPLTLFLLVPYYISAFPLPSKDILVAAVFVLVARHLSTGQQAQIALPLCLATALYFVRDGYALILIASLIAIRVGGLLRLGERAIVIGTGVAASVFWLLFESAFEDSFLYARALGVAAQSDVLDLDTSSTPSGYFIRLLGNATNLAFRPVFWDWTGSLHIVSVFYWVSGLTLLYALLCCWRALGSAHITDRRLGLLGSLSLLLVSVAPYVQPRYLLPICLLIPMFSFSSVAALWRSLTIIILISIGAASLYLHIGNYPPANDRIPFTLLSDEF